MKSTKEMGITLLQIPYWWDKKIASLRATIAKVRPDIVKVQNTDVDIPRGFPTK